MEDEEEEEEETGTAPHFIQPLKSQKINLKLPLTLKCVVDGTPVPTVKWFAKSREIKSRRGKEITFNPETGIASLKILKPTPEDQCIYSVQVVNSFGRAECRADFYGDANKVQKPAAVQAPKITLPLEARIVLPGKSFTLEAEFDGDPPPYVKWYHNGRELPPKPNMRITTGECKSCLHISEVEKVNGGKYEIRAVNSAGEARSSGSLTIKEPQPEMIEVIPPRFVKPLVSQDFAEGEVVILEAVVESHPHCTFQWFLNLMPISYSDELRIVSSSNRSILFIDEVQIHHGGLYMCRAENVGGSIASTATVNVLPELPVEESRIFESPRFVKKLVSERVMDGEEVSLTCQVVGKPIPHITWLHKNEPIKEEKDILIYQDSEGVCKLTIQEVFPEDSGDYSCRAVNPLGEAVCSAALVVEAYEYVPDSEIAPVRIGSSMLSSSEEDILSEKATYWRSIYDSDYDE